MADPALFAFRRRRAELERDGVPEAKIAEHLGFPDVRAMRRSLSE